MKTLGKIQMWWLLLALVAAAAYYAYTIRDTIKIAPKAGCNTCPNAAKEKYD